MDIPSSLPFSKAFDYASGAIGSRFQNPFWKVKEFFWGGPLRRAVSEVKQFGSALVSTAAQKRLGSENGKVKEPQGQRSVNLIDSLLDHIDDKAVVADAAMNYLSAGKSGPACLIRDR